MARRFPFNLRAALLFADKTNSEVTCCFLFVTKPMVKRNYCLNETISNETTG
jgi:hypothetical protein